MTGISKSSRQSSRFESKFKNSRRVEGEREGGVKWKPVQARHFASAIAQEAARPRTGREWIALAAETLGLVPCLHLPMGAVSACIALLKRDYVEFGMTVSAMVCLPGMARLLFSIVRRVRALGQGFRLGSGLAARAQTLAQKPMRPPPSLSARSTLRQAHTGVIPLAQAA